MTFDRGSTETRTASTTGPLLHGRYEVGETLSTEGFFSVHQGRDTVTGRPVAIKTLNAEFRTDTEFVTRLRDELEATLRLEHLGIAQLYDVWEADGTLTFVTEWVRGINLKERIRRFAPFPLAVAIDIGAAVSEILQTAAESGFVHGDLRPEQIIITPDGHVKVTDFGVGRAVAASSRVQVSAMLQSARYRPPEQANGRPPDAAGDVYAQGILLYEMLAGQVPYDGETAFAIAVKHLHDQPTSLRRHNPGVPRGVEAVVMKCLQKDPTQRYPSSEDLSADLRSLREALRFGRPLDAPPQAPRRKGAVGDHRPPTTDHRPTTNDQRPSPMADGAGSDGAMAVGERAAGVDLTPPILTPPPAPLPETERGSQVSAAPRKLEGRVSTPLSASGRGDRGEGSTPDRKPARKPRAIDPDDDRRGEPSGWLLVFGFLAAIAMVAGGFFLMARIFKAPKDVPVPPLMQLSQADALARAQSVGLTLVVERQEFDDVYPKGTVMKVIPPPGTSVKEGRAIRVWLSKGIAPVEVPEVTGLPLKRAREAIRAENLVVGRIADEFSDSIPKGDIISQSPPGGRSVPRRTSVSLVVSKGEEPPPPKPDPIIPEGDPSTPLETRTFDVTITMPEGPPEKQRLRIEVTDQNGPHDVVNATHRAGETVKYEIQAYCREKGAIIRTFVDDRLYNEQIPGTDDD
jgi:serine/threonine-protein kinase